MSKSPVADLEVQSLTKRYGSFCAVNDVSFTVDHGSFFSILGPSGCGKTTLLRIMAGFLASDEGDIRIGGRSMRGVPPNRRPVNMVFQHLALFPMMDVGQNVGYGLARRGVSRSEIDRRVGEMLERVGLAGSQAKRVEQLSGGQKQRVAIARSLVLEPTLLLLDEPLGALDLKLREHMKVELKQLQASFGTTFVYITHDQSEALVMSDRVAVMQGGRFEQVGAPQDLYYAPQTAFVAGFVGSNNRISARVESIDQDVAVLCSADGLQLRARTRESLRPGDAVQAFVRPEAIVLGRDGAALSALGVTVQQAQVDSVLFDGANSAVLAREVRSGQLLRMALPQTGQFADVAPGAQLLFGFDPDRAVCFGSGRSAGADPDVAH